MSTEATKGFEALKASKYDEAVMHLTTALKTSQSPLWLIQRSTAYHRLGKYELALADAEKAYLVAQSRARREHMATAQFRRALALFGLKRYGDARLCLNWTRKLNEKERALGMWQEKVKTMFQKAEEEGDEEKTRTSVFEVPEKVEEVAAVVEKPTKGIPVVSKGKIAGKENIAPVRAPLQQTPKEKIRVDWYQSYQTVSITIMAKGVPKDKAEIIFTEGSLEVSFPIAAADTYDYTISPLFAKIDPTTSTFRITPHKIEITLQKSMQNLKWGYLEGTEPIPSSTDTTSDAPAPIPEGVLKPSKATAPAYPTSSRTGPKDWENIGDDEEDEGGDGVEDFFKKLYKGADPDSQKAMMKSYQESNGTALSTNWEDVKKGPVETNPPEGVVAKKWGE